jgi:nucleoside-diphosphate-sugar epimerase
LSSQVRIISISFSFELISSLGAAGFIGSYVVQQLFAKGYKVRAVVRDISKEDRYAILKSFPHKDDQLEFVEGDINNADYVKILEGAHAVLHLASPYLYASPDPQKEIVDPAIKGVV